MDGVKGIALSGKMKSGKSTLAEQLLFSEGSVHRAEIAHFAGPLKSGLATMGIKKDIHPALYRMAAQYIGTELVRAYDPNWWVQLMDTHYRLYEVDPGLFIIDDLRFPNELIWSELNEFLTVRVEVSPETQLLRGAEEEKMLHESETALDDIPDGRFNLIIPENTTVEERVQLVLAALEEKERYAREAPYQPV